MALIKTIKGADLDLSAEEQNGRRCRSPSAAVAIAAEAESGLVCTWQRIGISPRLASALSQVSLGVGRFSEITDTAWHKEVCHAEEVYRSPRG